MIARRVMPALILAALGALPAVVFARPHRVDPLPPGTPFHAQAQDTVACHLGVTGTSALLGPIYPSDDIFYTLLEPTTCGQCSLTALTNVHISLEFRTPCSLPIAIGVVQAFGTQCKVPDPVHVVFPSFATTLTATEVGITEFTVPVPTDWKLVGAAFLSVSFTAVTDSCSDSNTNQPRMALRAGCPQCTTYESFSGTVTDVCESDVAIPLISADVSECVLTPTLSRSWGDLKILYR